MALMSLCIGVHACEKNFKEYPSKCACLCAKALFVCVCVYICGSVDVHTCNIWMMLVC